MKININELKDWQSGARRTLGSKMDGLRYEMEEINNYMRALDIIDKLLAEIDNLNELVADKQAETDSLHQQLQEGKELRTKLEMELKETKKLAVGVANKTSQEAMLKVISVFVNKSKQKRIEKRIMVKSMVMEMVMANGLSLPDDLAATIDALDDEQPEPRVVNVEGNYNDVHDNTSVING